MTTTVLDNRALNRATLARQQLLTRGDASVPEAVVRLCGLQAQEPQEPFIGLWSRLADFKPERLDDALTGRSVVPTHLTRRTVHLVASEDVLAWRARHDTMLRQRVLGAYRRELAGTDLDEVAAAGRAVMADRRPRTMSELVQAVEDRWPGPPRRVLGELLVAALILHRGRRSRRTAAAAPLSRRLRPRRERGPTRLERPRRPPRRRQSRGRALGHLLEREHHPSPAEHGGLTTAAARF
ncbi:DNA glycosylase AlkZ-like family protein [Streptomyces sp. NPDC002643]